jgi:putative glutamine amidotransferase
MRRTKFAAGTLAALGALLLLTGLSFAEKITVIVFYPTEGTIKHLMVLRENKLIDVPDLEVVGVYHEKEKTNYGKSRAFASSRGLDWLTFHPVSAPIRAETVFQKNDCTQEFERIFEQADGVILFGGPDIPPYLYREKTSFLTIITDPYRHFLEASFVFHLLGGDQDSDFKPFLDRRPDFPILGLCLGGQTLNVGTGGTLVQDIWSEVFGAATVEEAIALGPSCWHSNPYSHLLPREGFAEFTLHEIRFTGESRFAKEIAWDEKVHPLILSGHHQQVEKLGRGFRTIASSLDGKVIEGFEHEKYRHVLGLQFHPEARFLFDRNYRTRFTPQDKEPVSLTRALQEHPGSLEFHRKLWSWVCGAWEDEHRKR